MYNYFEKIAKLIYSEWKSIRRVKAQEHPDEENLACFLEGKLSEADKLFMEKHLVNCNICAEYVGVHLLMHTDLTVNLPDKLLEKVKKLVIGEDEVGFFEILLKLKEKPLRLSKLVELSLIHI